MVTTCVFCGKSPENKNKEHILPQWLLGLTGNPNRIVTFGINYETGKPISFSWKSFTVPSCTACNEKFSDFEGKIKSIIEKLQSKQNLTGNETIKLLDWFDKVRIGLWHNYYYIEKNKAGISPRMFINSRIGKKDRFLQVHFLQSEKPQKGLNAFGVESLAFQYNPSCLALRINSLLIINGSNDFVISKNCGFPYPKKIVPKDNEGLEFSDWEYNRTTHTDIQQIEIYKGVLTLMQPIHSEIRYNTNFFTDSYLIENTIGTKSQIGTLFRIQNNKCIPISNLNNVLEYEEVKGDDCKRAGDLISMVYKLQNIFLSIQANPKYKEIYDLAKKVNIDYEKHYQGLSKNSK